MSNEPFVKGYCLWSGSIFLKFPLASDSIELIRSARFPMFCQFVTISGLAQGLAKRVAFAADIVPNRDRPKPAAQGMFFHL